MNSLPIRHLLAAVSGSIVMGIVSLSAPAPIVSFDTPEAAVTALRAAVVSTNLAGIKELFGPAGSYLVNPDPVMAANDLRKFSDSLIEAHHLSVVDPDRQVLDVGNQEWPFPMPLVQVGGRWQFDADAGREEILNRRIGANELDVLQSLRAFVAAQREYASEDRDGDDVLEYARKFLSSPGKKDGLYWPPDLDGSESPLGPAIAAAQDAGYTDLVSSTEAATSQPFHGYYFRILTRQGKHTPAGAYDYIINGHMIGGFAAVAWPVEYGETGVMTFLVNQQGRVYQSDLGPRTVKIAGKMTEYDTGAGWGVSSD